jgi:hypothetical protein
VVSLNLDVCLVNGRELADKGAGQRQPDVHPQHGDDPEQQHRSQRKLAR